MGRILSEWQVAYGDFLAEEKIIQNTIEKAKKRLSEATPPYKGWNPVRRFKEGKAHTKFVETTEHQIQEAKTALETAQISLGQETQSLFFDIFPSPVIASINNVIFKEEALDSSASRKSLIERALTEFEEVQEQVGDASDFEFIDMVGNNPGLSLLSHFETEEAAEGLEDFRDTLEQVAKQFCCTSGHQKISNPTEGWSFDADLFAGLADIDVLSVWTSFLNMNKLDEVAEQLDVIGPHLKELDEALAKEVIKHQENLAQAREDCVSLVLNQIDQSVVDGQQADLLKTVVTTLPVEILFSKKTISSAGKTGPTVGIHRTASFDRSPG